MEYNCDINKPYFFVSYSHRDKEIVHSFVDTLSSRGLNIWIDKALYAGDDWKQKVGKAIVNENCKALLFFRSMNSIYSPQITYELKLAMDTRKANISELNIRIIVIDIDKNAKDFLDEMRLNLIRLNYEMSVLERKKSSGDATSNEKFEDEINTKISCSNFHLEELGESKLSTYIKDEGSLNLLFKSLDNYGYIIDKAIVESMVGEILNKFRDDLKEVIKEEVSQIVDTKINEVKDEIQEIKDELQSMNQAAAAVSPPANEHIEKQETEQKARTAATKITDVRVMNERYAVKTQGEALSQVLELLLKINPDAIERITKLVPSISTQLESKAQFNSYSITEINGQSIYIGTSLSMNDKLKAINTVCSCLGIAADSAAFIDVDEYEHFYMKGQLVRRKADANLVVKSSTTETFRLQDKGAGEGESVREREGEGESAAAGARNAAAKITQVRVLDRFYDVKNQSEAMSVVVGALLAKNPAVIDQVIQKVACISRTIENKAQFHSSSEHIFGDQKVYVGTHLSMKDKLSAISNVCRIVGVDQQTASFIDQEGYEYQFVNGNVQKNKLSQNV